jgi:hypothetical protein
VTKLRKSFIGVRNVCRHFQAVLRNFFNAPGASEMFIASPASIDG